MNSSPVETQIFTRLIYLAALTKSPIRTEGHWQKGSSYFSATRGLRGCYIWQEIPLQTSCSSFIFLAAIVCCVVYKICWQNSWAYIHSGKINRIIRADGPRRKVLIKDEAAWLEMTVIKGLFLCVNQSRNSDSATLDRHFRVNFNEIRWLVEFISNLIRIGTFCAKFFQKLKNALVRWSCVFHPN